MPDTGSEPVASTPTDEVRTTRLEAVMASVDRLKRVAAGLWAGIEEDLGLTEVAGQALAAIGAGARTVSSVADACRRHVSSASRIVDALVQRGLVDRIEDAEDRRAVRLTLTPDGRDALAQIEEFHRSTLAATLASLDDEDVAQLALLLPRLADAAEETTRPS